MTGLDIGQGTREWKSVGDAGKSLFAFSMTVVPHLGSADVVIAAEPFTAAPLDVASDNLRLAKV